MFAERLPGGRSHLAFEAPNDAGGVVSPPAPKPIPPGPPPSQRGEDPVGYSADFVKDLRAENRSWREKAAEQEAARKSAEEGVAKAKAEAADKIKEAEAKHQEAMSAKDKAILDRTIDAELKVSAIKAGIVDLDGLKLIDRSSLKITDAGQVEGVDDLIAKTKEAKPYLFGAPVPGGNSNPANPPRKQPNEPKLAKDMTDAERRSFLADHQRKFGR